ncbi:uncharacterized protein LOC111241576 [Vigna radiata var. radiata]|uniref:Uncharacterized protein LOC111241576 n=1 Tax=Vigna radiata var. radiata TaxID=3916 RepID=A0A3Q0F0N8_VIGRR|nr:uncharacterized protein LOC111241576 [Vigna radiata var. radiata]
MNQNLGFVLVSRSSLENSFRFSFSEALVSICVPFFWFLLLRCFNRRFHRRCRSQSSLSIVSFRYDCGMLVIKYMELWDHLPKFDGNKISYYTTEQLQIVRQEMVCQWVLHEDNVHRTMVLKKFGML